MSKPTYIKHKLSNVVRVGRIVVMRYYEFDKDFFFEGEAHDFWEFVYADKGDITICAGDEWKTLSQGEIVFHKPNEFHAIKCNGESAANIFVFSFECRSQAMSFFEGRHIALPRELRPLLTKLIEEGYQNFNLKSNSNIGPLENAPIGGQQLIRLYLEELLIMLLRSGKGFRRQTEIFTTREGLENHIVNEIIKYLESRVYSTASLNEICEKLHYGKTYLCTLFKNTTDHTIMSYYNNLKIAEAKKLIRERKYNFTQIANLLSFDNPHYFSSTFKRVAGMTPREYSNSVKI